MIFQTLDDKTECVGVYADGSLFFEKFPEALNQTWRYTGSHEHLSNVEYAWLYAQGQTLEEVCPDSLEADLSSASAKMRAYRKSFEIAKIDLRDQCFIDLVPHDALVEFC